MILSAPTPATPQSEFLSLSALGFPRSIQQVALAIIEPLRIPNQRAVTISTDPSEIAQNALALSDDERARLAQQLWENLTEPACTPPADELAANADEASARVAELTAGTVPAQSHEDAMRAAREEIQ